jgi:hypothetical protein
MSDPLSVVKTGQSLYTMAQKPLSRFWQWGRVRVFKLRNRKPPLNDAKAKQAATSVLGGDVPTAISFRNISTEHILIAALRRSSEKDFDWRVFLLEQLGSTFQIVWKSDMLCSFTKSQIEVQDIDGDGNCEVIYEDQSFGTGGGSRSLYVYFPDSRKLHSLTESLNWQSLSGPVSPEVRIEPQGDAKLVSQIERVASTRGFLKPSTEIDFDKPEFAAQRWHKENGKFPQGKIKIHYYQGLPHILSTLVATIRASDRVWFSFFKGLLVEYDPVKDQHFVVYSPAWFYNWVKCMSFDGERLWCGAHCMNGLISYEPRTGVLAKYEKYQGKDLPEIENISSESGTLILNKTLRLSVSGFPRPVQRPILPGISAS